MKISRKLSSSALGIMSAMTVLTLLISFFLGRYPQPYFTSFTDFMENALAREVLLNIRMPRIITAFLLGMVLSASGTVFQMVFRNPLVEAKFLGVSGGAAFGASLAIVFMGGTVYAVQGCAAFFAFAGLACSYAIATRVRFGDWVLRLILAGIAVSALFWAGSGILKYMADPLRQLPEITFWLLGGIWGITWADTIHIMVVSIPCLVIIYMMRWRLNLLSMRDETAFSLVSRPGMERMVLLMAAVISVAAVVSKAGQITWVGLIVPHISRRLVGSDAQKALPCALLLGGFFTLICDNMARTLISGEIPLGILTSFSGALVFIFMVISNRIQLKES